MSDVPLEDRTLRRTTHGPPCDCLPSRFAAEMGPVEPGSHLCGLPLDAETMANAFPALTKSLVEP